jgi:hypothetical protein
VVLVKKETEATEFVNLVNDDTDHKIEVEDLRILFESKMESLSSIWVFLLGIGFVLIATTLSTTLTVIEAARYLFAVVPGVWVIYNLITKRNPALTRNKVFQDYLKAKGLIEQRTH